MEEILHLWRLKPYNHNQWDKPPIDAGILPRDPKLRGRAAAESAAESSAGALGIGIQCRKPGEPGKWGFLSVAFMGIGIWKWKFRQAKWAFIGFWFTKNGISWVLSNINWGLLRFDILRFTDRTLEFMGPWCETIRDLYHGCTVGIPSHQGIQQSWPTAFHREMQPYLMMQSIDFILQSWKKMSMTLGLQRLHLRLHLHPARFSVTLLSEVHSKLLACTVKTTWTKTRKNLFGTETGHQEYHPFGLVINLHHASGWRRMSKLTHFRGINMDPNCHKVVLSVGL